MGSDVARPKPKHPNKPSQARHGSYAPCSHTIPRISAAPVPPRVFPWPSGATGAHGLPSPRPLPPRHASVLSDPFYFYRSHERLSNLPLSLSLSLFPVAPRRLGIPPPTLTSGPHLSSSPPPPPLAGRQGDEDPVYPPPLLPAPGPASVPCAADPSGPQTASRADRFLRSTP